MYVVVLYSHLATSVMMLVQFISVWIVIEEFSMLSASFLELLDEWPAEPRGLVCLLVVFGSCW